MKIPIHIHFLPPGDSTTSFSSLFTSYHFHLFQHTTAGSSFVIVVLSRFVDVLVFYNHVAGEKISVLICTSFVDGKEWINIKGLNHCVFISGMGLLGFMIWWPGF